jgi:dUTP pyrophosphatase
MSLYLYVIDPAHRELQRQHVLNRRSTDSGVDLICQEKILDVAGFSNNLGLEIKTGIVAAALDAQGNSVPYLLLARSSTSLTPLRMSNQVGLADAGYRGELIARVDCFDTSSAYYTIPEGRRLFQIVQHNWLPFNQVIMVNSVEELPAAPDNRGDGGFGSTGN